MEQKHIVKEKIKEQLHKRLPASVFLHDASVSELELRRIIAEATSIVLRKDRAIKLSADEQGVIVDEIVNEILGLGSIEDLLSDEEITEIMINGPEQVYIEKGGKLELTDIRFRNDEELMFMIEKMLAPLGRRVNETETYVDARLKDGFRVNIVIPPTSAIGPVISIHKFSHKIFSITELIKFKTLTKETAEFLQACVASRMNILISGGTSCGKTSLLNVLSSFIPKDERIIVIEDTLELRLAAKHVVRMESKLPNIEGKGEITIRDLLKNTLHMRPDRIIIGEIRGEEVLDMLQAMNTGHEGSMTTLHANAPYEALSRIELMALMGAGPNVSSRVIMRQIISAADLIVHLERSSVGRRCITHITEFGKEKTDEYALRDIFCLKDKISNDISENIELGATGVIPSFYDKLKRKCGYDNPNFKVR